MLKNIDIAKRLAQGTKVLFLFVAVMLLTACQDDHCPTVQDYLTKGIGNNCLLCRLFEIITKAASTAANKSWSTFAPQLIPVVAVTASIYVAIFTLKNIGSFTKQNVADYLTGDKKGVMMLLFKAAVIILLLGDTFMTDNIITPILAGGLEIGGQLAVTKAPPIPAGAAGGGWDGLFAMINEYVKAFNDEAYQTIALGEAMCCNAVNNNEWGFFSWEWLMLFYGLILYCFGWVLLAGISFYIVDILVRLAFGAILLPFGVACAISGQTTGYTKNIWNVFLNAFFSFVLLGIMIGIAIQLINLGMTMGDNKNSPNTDGVLVMFLTNFQAQLNENQIKKLSEELWTSGDLLLTIVCFCVTVQLTAQMGKMAEKISGTGGLTSVGSQVAGAVGKPLIAKGKQVGGAVTGWGKSGVKYAGHVSARITRLDKLSKFGRASMEDFQGTLTGTGRRGYKAFWRKK